MTRTKRMVLSTTSHLPLHLVLAEGDRERERERRRLRATGGRYDPETNTVTATFTGHLEPGQTYELEL